MRCGCPAPRGTTCRTRFSSSSKRSPTSRFSSSTSATEVFSPLVVDPIGHFMQALQARLQVLLHRFGLLHRGARGRGRDFPGAAARPGADHLLGHLDVALHGEVLADGKRLVHAMRILEDARGARRDAEGFAVPLEGLEGLQLAKPCARYAVVA